MNVLVTAGNTLVRMDRVRSLTNVFSGRTGAAVALQAFERGHAVTLLTSRPETVVELRGAPLPASGRWKEMIYRTFDDLQHALQDQVSQGGADVLIHSAAVSDYRPAGVYAPDPGTRFQEGEKRWESTTAAPPTLIDRSADKVKSDEPELWIRLVRTPKLIDLVRTEWGFGGLVVKFKLEVGIPEESLVEIAERSRRQSAADLMVANTLEGMHQWAYLGPLQGHYQRITRQELPTRLLEAVEALHREKNHG
ncbi:MAG: bifunctional phosphopantothenoylcysteine decarboxylase/phosphopantothenate synthase [Planctomycetes bacterium]|nr:bifunctional phosphopantothenoylcysteine decarboxylase/phosphopantothenate synthase [Planctomycetota bacterium]